MIESITGIGALCDEISRLLDKHYQGEGYSFPDSIKTLIYSENSQSVVLETLLLDKQLSASAIKYNKQLVKIIKYCGKQSILLAHPSGDEDCATVHEAFKEFISVTSGKRVFL